MKTLMDSSSLNLQGRFSRLLNEQLDELNFPSEARRAAALSSALDVAKTQAYKLLKGMASPSLSNLLRLRKMGASIDEMLDLLGEKPVDAIELHLLGHQISATIRYASDDIRTPLVVVPREDQSGADLVFVAQGAPRPPGAKPIKGLTFPFKISLAIVEDNTSDLEMLEESLESLFRLGTYTNASSLLTQSVEGFDLFLLDWNLPDMRGLDLVKTIRARSQAPIFILTADRTASDEIVQAMDFAGVHHATKPVDIKILAKRLMSAGRNLPSSSA